MLSFTHIITRYFLFLTRGTNSFCVVNWISAQFCAICSLITMPEVLPNRCSSPARDSCPGKSSVPLKQQNKKARVFLTLPSVCKWRQIIHRVLSIGPSHQDSRVLSSVYDILRHISCWDDMLWQIFKKVYPWALNCSNYAFSITVAYQGALLSALGKEAGEGSQ